MFLSLKCFFPDEPLRLISEGDQHCINTFLKANQICRAFVGILSGYLDRYRMDEKQN